MASLYWDHSQAASWIQIHWNENVIILTKFPSLAALEVVILTTSSAASDENFIKMKTFPFQRMLSYQYTMEGLRSTLCTHVRTFHMMYDPFHNLIPNDALALKGDKRPSH